MANLFAQSQFNHFYNNLNVAETDGTIFDDLQTLQTDSTNFDWHIYVQTSTNFDWHIYDQINTNLDWHIFDYIATNFDWHIFTIDTSNLGWRIFLQQLRTLSWNIFEDADVLSELDRYYADPKDFSFEIVKRVFDYEISESAPHKFDEDEMETFYLPEKEYGPMEIKVVKYTYNSGVKQWQQASSIN